MGNSVSPVKAHVTRPFREYNLQDRAHNAALRNKYVVSPKHPSTEHLIKTSIESIPSDVKESMSEVDNVLESRLRKVYVTSKDIKPVQPPPRATAERPLPLNRIPVGQHEFGFYQPKVVPYGKTSLKSALQFISKHQEDPDSCTARDIALSHKLDVTLTENVLKHFGTFRLMVPANLNDKQRRMLEELQGSTSFLPNTAGVRAILNSVAMKGRPDPVDTKAKIPMEQLQEPADDPRKKDITLLNPSVFTSLEDDGIKDTRVDGIIENISALEDDASTKDTRVGGIIENISGNTVETKEVIAAARDSEASTVKESNESAYLNMENIPIRSARRKQVIKDKDQEDYVNKVKNSDAT